jgi:hypothetical protein
MWSAWASVQQSSRLTLYVLRGLVSLSLWLSRGHCPVVQDAPGSQSLRLQLGHFWWEVLFFSLGHPHFDWGSSQIGEYFPATPCALGAKSHSESNLWQVGVGDRGERSKGQCGNFSPSQKWPAHQGDSFLEFLHLRHKDLKNYEYIRGKREKERKKKRKERKAVCWPQSSLGSWLCYTC